MRNPKKNFKKENKKSETALKCPHRNKSLNKTGFATHIRLLQTSVFQKTSICQFCGKKFKIQEMPKHIQNAKKYFQQHLLFLHLRKRG